MHSLSLYYLPVQASCALPRSCLPQSRRREGQRYLSSSTRSRAPPFSASFTTAIGAIARHSAKDSVFFFLAMAESDQSMGASEFVNCNWLDILPEGVEWYTKNVGKLDKARLLSIAVNGPPSSGIPFVDGCSQFLHSFSRTVVSLQ
jgi:hypothetical protein